MTPYQMIPTLTSLAGSCLTMAQWQEAGIRIIALEVAELLIKPGLTVLSTLTDIKQYCAWPGDLVLNTRGLSLDNETIKLRSSYDGSLITLSSIQVLQLLQQLKPARIIRDAIGEEGYLQKDLPIVALKSLCQSYPSLFIETNKPAQDGFSGKVYSGEEEYSIFDGTFQKDFRTLDETCSCIVCKQLFTRAYFHHLVQHTPLLAQRLIIQHNVSFYQNYLAGLSLRDA